MKKRHESPYFRHCESAVGGRGNLGLYASWIASLVARNDTLRSALGILVVCLVLLPQNTFAGGLDPRADWPMYGGNTQQNKVGANTSTAPMTLKWRSDPLSDRLWAFNWGNAPTLTPSGIYMSFRIETNGGWGIANFDYNGHLKWNTYQFPNIPFAESVTPITADDAGNMWIGHFRNGGVSTFSPTSGAKNFINLCPDPPANGAVSIDPSGNAIYMQGQLRGEVSCSPTGVVNWQTNNGGSQNQTGVPAISSDGIVYVNNTTTCLKARNAKTGAVIWSVDFLSPVPICSNNTNVMLSFDEKVLYTTDQFFHTAAFDAKTGATKWILDNTNNPDPFAIEGDIYSAVGLGPDGTFYFSNRQRLPCTVASGCGTGSIVALNPKDGSVKWEYKLRSWDDKSNDAKVTGNGQIPKLLVDKAGTIYAYSRGGYVLGLNPDGTLKFTYRSGNPSGWAEAFSMDKYGTLYTTDDKTMSAMWPWTADVTLRRVNDRQVQFNARTTMQQKEPSSTIREQATGANNFVQAYLENGDKVPLKFIHKNADGTTEWEGVYTLPKVADMNSIVLTGQIEESAQGQRTATPLHFDKLTPRFFNSGIKQDFSYKLGDLDYPSRQVSGGGV